MHTIALTLFLTISSVVTYKPVVIFHGLNGIPRELEFFADVIKKEHPNTTVHIIEALHALASFLPLWHQIDIYQERAMDFMEKHPEGVHFIGYSQGGVIARGVIETSTRHNVNTLISIIAPQMGGYGRLTKTVGVLDDWLSKVLHRFVYTVAGQHISIGNLWRDPFYMKDYFRENKFLPFLNNEIKHPCFRKFKRNFSRLKKLVLIGLTDDDVVHPWITSQFGSVDENGNLVDYRHQNVRFIRSDNLDKRKLLFGIVQVYKKDSFGLRTLDERGDVITINFSGILHNKLQFSEDFIKEFVVKWLD